MLNQNEAFFLESHIFCFCHKSICTKLHACNYKAILPKQGLSPLLTWVLGNQFLILYLWLAYSKFQHLISTLLLSIFLDNQTSWRSWASRKRSRRREAQTARVGKPKTIGRRKTKTRFGATEGGKTTAARKGTKRTYITEHATCGREKERKK